MGSDGVHVSTGGMEDLHLLHNPEGTDNALAILAAIQDLLEGSGVKLKYKKRTNRLELK